MNKILEEKIESLVSCVSFTKLKKAAEELSSAYRLQTGGIKSLKFMAHEEHKYAYLALRMPATYAAIQEVLKQIHEPISSLLDVGSGPGTAYLAACNQFSELKEVLLIEKDPQMIKLGQELLMKALYQHQALEAYRAIKSYDLVIAAYALSELPDENLSNVIQELWKSTGKYLCLIESGTPYGFKTILQVRKQLIELKANLVAPCTHEEACPMEKGHDWCHFSVRFERTKLQKRVKEATLGYEDEKYSYIIASKNPVPRPLNRIVKTPVKRSGFISFTVSNANGLENKIFSKKDREIYLQAKKLEWGDTF